MYPRVLVLLFLTSISSVLLGQSTSQPGSAQSPTPAATAGGSAVYQQLRQASLSGEAVTLNNYTLKRDGGTFTLDGTVSFVAPVEGKVTGAVFTGSGTFTIHPPTAVERRSVAIYLGPNFSEHFKEAVFRFTDDTYADLKKAGSAGAAAAGGGALSGSEGELHDGLKYNLPARILEDLLNPDEPDGIFWAFIHGDKYGKLVYIVDPHGVPAVGNFETGFQLPNLVPEEVALLTYGEQLSGVWTAFHRPGEYASGVASSREQNGTVQITDQKLDTHIEKSGYLSGRAETTFVASQGGVRVVPFDLFPKLRVSSVTDASGAPLDYIQEAWNHDSQFWVILPKGLKSGEKTTIKVTYAGKDAVTNEGNGNYFPVAREDWYPNTIYSALGSFANFDMTFHVPKGTQLVATGDQTGSSREGDEDVTTWKSSVPIPVAGFTLGRFKHEQAQMKDPAVLVQSFANENPPNWVSDYLRAGTEMVSQGELNTSSHVTDEDTNVGHMDTVNLLKKPLAEGQLATQIYTAFYGPMDFTHVAYTQQTACDFGQSWPGLVYIPICSFFDNTVKQRLGILNGDRGYWTAVTAHETAHQWWGQTVGFNSYRDQWMSEGFAEFSASLFVQQAYGMAGFNKFWNDELWLMTQKSRTGARPIDVGSVTDGLRLSNSKADFDTYRRLVYPKGAYIVHMIRMLMWDPKEGDKAFKAMMHDFVQTYRGQPATTEDFKAMLEKHMTPGLDFDHNGKMDWFFNDYVYGTDLPDYQYNYSFDKDSAGKVVMHLSIAQGNVGPNFKMGVPVYVRLDKDKVVRLGMVPITGANKVDLNVPLGVTEAPMAVILNYHNDVLGTVEPMK